MNQIGEMNSSITSTNINEMIQKQKQTIIKIYTDWANHYLKKRYYELDKQQSQLLSNDQSSSISSKIPAASSSKLCNNRNNRPLITSLINDLHDGVLLIHLVESVTDSTLLTKNVDHHTSAGEAYNNHQTSTTSSSSLTLSTITLMPKNVNQMIANIDSCICFLERLGINTKGIYAKVKNPHQSLYHNGDLMTISSCTSGEEDDNNTAGGFMTDFSISSSTQSLILSSSLPSSSNGKNFITSSSNMAPPPTSGVTISRLPNQNHINNNFTGSGNHGNNHNNKINNTATTTTTKLVQPTINNNNNSGNSSSIPTIPSIQQQQNNRKSSSTNAKVTTTSSSNLQQQSNNNNSTSNITSSTALPQINRIQQQHHHHHHNHHNRTTTPPSDRFVSSNTNHSRPSRPQSTSSIPQIGNLSSVVKPAVVPTKKSTSSTNSRITTKNSKSSSDNESVKNNKTKSSNGLNNSVSRLNPSQSELNLRKSTTTTVPGKSGRQLQLRRLPTPTTTTSGNSNQPRRPISTIIESSIPSMITMMTTSCPSSTTTITNGITTTMMNPQQQQQQSTMKPTATVKAMVTPIMSTIDSPNHKIDKQTKCPQKGIISSRSTDSTQSLNYKNDVNCSNNDHHMKNNNINGSSLSLKKDTNDMDLQLSLKKKSNINRRQNSLGSTNSVGNGGGDSTSDGDGNISEDMETPPIIPPVMERPLQTISYLKSNANVSTSNSTTNIQNVVVQPNIGSSRTTTPTIMYRKPENQQTHYQRTGRSHYEPLYSNGTMNVPSNIHRLSQGADYYGSIMMIDIGRDGSQKNMIRLKHSFSNHNHSKNSNNIISHGTTNNRGFEESSSLSSDTGGGGGGGGGICGVANCNGGNGSRCSDVSTTTTTTTSSCSSSLDPRVNHMPKSSIKFNQNQQNRSNSSPNKSLSNSTTELYKTISPPQPITMTKLIGQSGTLPMNSSGSGHYTKNNNITNNRSNIVNQNQRFLKSSKLRSQTLANDGSVIYSDSECQQPQNHQSQSRSTFSLYKLPIGPQSSNVNNSQQVGNQSTNMIQNTTNFCSSSKDGGHYSELIYSNIHSGNNSSRPTTDTDSIDSLNTIGSDRASSIASQSIYGVHPSLGHHTNNHHHHHHHHPLSKPGDLICEYESVNRLRETMSASPTSNKMFTNSNGVYSDTNSGTSGNNNNNNTAHIGRSGSFRLPGTSTNHHLPPIPAHLNKIKQQQQQQQLQHDQQHLPPTSEHSASSLSLLSSNSSAIFTTPEEKYIHEIRRLRRELDQANEKIYTLTSQLTANAHMVAAFEQSLSSMTTRLQQLSSTSELKDCELERLRKTIDVLKKQGGSLVGHAKSATIMNPLGINGDKFQRYLSNESVNSISSCGAATDSSIANGKTKKKSKLKLTGSNTSWIRSSFSRAFKKKSSSKTRDSSQHGRDVASDVEMTSGTGQSEPEGDVHSVPSSPLMSIRSRAKSAGVNMYNDRNASRSTNHPQSLSESKAFESDTMAETSDLEEMKDLRKQLREKEMQLTDMRLESLTSAHQLENLKEIVNQMRAEMMNLKQDNDRLQRLVHHKSLASSQSSMTSAIGSHGSSTLPPSAITLGNSGLVAPMEDSNSFESVDMDMSPLHSSNTTNSNDESPKLVTLGSGSHTLATLTITTKTNWDQLDTLIKKCFKDHLIRVDSSLALGITVDSLACYRVGTEKILRNFYPFNHHHKPTVPELLPFGYLVNENHINLQFKTTIDSLAFDTLTPKSVLNEFISMLIENRRLIFSGPSGTGKTYLAHKLAEYMAIKQMDSSSVAIYSRAVPNIGGANCVPPSGAITTFNVDHKNAKELRAYLTNIAEQCQLEVALTPLPTVIILDNLHHSIDSLEDIFNDLDKISIAKSPYIIGTINQSVHHHQTMPMFQRHNFHWIMLSVNSEAVRGYLNRFLRRKLLETESRLALSQQKIQPEVVQIIEWIPKVYSHLNKFLENYFGENISIGSRLFTSCPIDLNGSQAWFTDLWNYSILPFIIENLREHVRQNDGKLKGKIAIHSFIDPTDWIVTNYPWSSNSEWSDHLNRLRPEDVEDDKQQHHQLPPPSMNQKTLITNSRPSSSNNNYHTNDNNQCSSNGLVSEQFNKSSVKDIKDPFLQMLLKLKEASEYSSQDIGTNNQNLAEQTITRT
ncbi:neuron navigator 2-like protein [Dermatophagoides farinae]|uniref:Neuron navigator 2-like protein n=1 Tax=Dermatophagoides farinae TaxID=6954 RepID=A0A9D4NYK2_DERFA|nr:neuron navigator 2-like protein [Dermatophagoides farinae]